MRTLGPYTLIRQLGAGGMGEVWVARREGLGGAARHVAIKTLLASKAEEESARKLFIEEGRLSMLLSNSNIVQVYEVERAGDGTCYMAMELIDGMDLSRLIRVLRGAGESLPPHLIGYILGEILKALAYSHELDHEGKRLCIVHRDISPHNVMISIRGEVKLMDFGIARMASEATSGLFVKGKLRYMPPEQVRGETREPTVDLFAVGAVLYELIEGKIFRPTDLAEEGQMVAIVIDGIVPKLEREVPAELAALYADLVAIKPASRPPTARDAYRRLASWSGYRDAKFDLEDLMRRFVTPASHSDMAMAAVATLAADPAATELLDGTSKTDLERKSTSPVTQTDVESRKPSPTPAPAPARPRNANAGLAIGLAAIGLGFGVLGIGGSLLGWWTPSEPPATALAEPSTVSEPAAAPAPGPAPMPKPTPEPTPEREPEGTTSGEETTSGEKTTGGDEETTRGAEPERKPAKVSVTIKAPSRFYAQIRLSGVQKPFTIDPAEKISSVRTSLKPGKYSVSFRDEVEGSWQDGGTVTIPAGGAVTLELVGSELVVK